MWGEPFGEESGDAAEFLRFGACQPAKLALAAWRYACGRGGGVWGLSVWWWANMSPVEIAWHACRDALQRTGRNPFPQGVMRVSPRAALHEFDALIAVRKTYGPGHYTVELPAFLLEHAFDAEYHEDRSTYPAYDVNASYFDQLAELFGPPMPNPVREL